MNHAEKLTVLKSDLQMMTSANDEYLLRLLDQAKNAIEREGIKLENDIEHDMLQIQYAAYLFRKRGSPETAMPKFLRWEMNNILFSQKAGRNDV